MDLKNILTQKELALLGIGQIAYVKRMRSDDLAQCFPQLPPIAPGIHLWGLFGAAGEPIALADERAVALASANEHDLKTVTLQ